MALFYLKLQNILHDESCDYILPIIDGRGYITPPSFEQLRFILVLESSL
jgi:hypothetical protein